MTRGLRFLVLALVLACLLVVSLVGTALAARPTYTCTYDGWGDGPFTGLTSKEAHERERTGLYICVRESYEASK